MNHRRGTYFESPAAPLPSEPYDYVVVGAGVYGLPLAYFIEVLFPGARVLVVEDNTIPGEGITVHTGGIIRSCYSNVDVMVASAFGRPYFAEPTATMGLSTEMDTGFVPTGWGRFVDERRTPGIVDELEQIVAAAEAHGIPGVWCADLESYLARVSPERRANLGKVCDLEDVTHVLVDDDGGYADGGSALLAFLEGALHRGADVARFCTVTGFVREDDGAVRGIRYRRWRPKHDGSGGRETLTEGTIHARHVIVSAGAGSRRLIERELGVKMATFPTFHQTPLVEDRTEDGFQKRDYLRGTDSAHPVTVADLPVVSHWRDLYFHTEGAGLVVGAHHRELHDEDYVPVGGTIPMGDTEMQVGLAQILLDKIVDNMEHFPALSEHPLRLGHKPEDVPGAFYVMNPEELPFEGPVPGVDGLFYVGSGSGTGFKLGPGVSYLLAQRLAGVPCEERLVTGDSLSIERHRYFYPANTTDAELRELFDPASGRFRHIGASGVGAGTR